MKQCKNPRELTEFLDIISVCCCLTARTEPVTFLKEVDVLKKLS
jgi:hypothetical protein